MDVGNEIQLISDGDGLAVIGNSSAVERFLASEGLPSKDLGLQRLRPALHTGAGVAQAGSEIVANSGRWVKLTKESAGKLEKYNLMKGSEPGVSRAVLVDKGKIKGLVEFTKTTPSSVMSNPALLSGAAGLMAQLAMKQAMDEIADYLATIDKKVDEVLRNQKDAVVADMIGVQFVIAEAMTLRDRMGKVSEVTWSKVQGTSMTIARTQAYAVGQLDALAEKLERETKVGDLAETAKNAQARVDEWLVILARCAALHDAIGVLELDRVLDADPAELDGHRLGLKAAKQQRLELLAQATGRLVARIDAAAGTANAKVLLNPTSAREVVSASNYVGGAVVKFNAGLGIESGRDALEARRWSEAATEARNKVLDTGADGVDAAKRLGSKTLGGAKSAGGKLSGKVSERARRLRGDSGERLEED